MPDYEPDGEPSPQEAYAGLREAALAIKPQQIGLSVGSRDIYGVIMETGFSGGASTLVATGDGSVSICFSTGGAVTGQTGDGRVLAAGRTFLAACGEFLSSMQPYADFPLPDAGRIRFYVLTPLYTYSYDADEEDLGYRRDPLWPLFLSGHDVITALRAASEPQAPQYLPPGSYVRITSVPPGEAPLAVREKWIGLALPLARGGLQAGFSSGVLTGSASIKMGFAVYSATAIQILAQSSPEAAYWWQTNAPQFLNPGKLFVFSAKCGEQFDVRSG